MLVDRAIARIRAYKSHAGWSREHLAREAGLNESTIRFIDNKDWSPTADTLRKLEKAIPSDFQSVETANDAPKKRKRAA